MIDVSNKNVLIIMPFFFDYHNMIKKVFNSMGAKVYLFNDNVETLKASYKLIYSLPFISTEKFLENYYARALSSISEDINLLFVIKGTSLNPQIISEIKSRYPNCYTILYEWDSAEKFPKAIKLAPCFNKCYTFDFEDADKFGWNYRPLFFEKYIEPSKLNKKYDYSFVGSLHSQRGKVVNLVDGYCTKNGLTSFLFLFSKKAGFIHQKYLNRNNSFDVPEGKIHFKPLSKDETNRIYDESKCVVDYQSTDQSGLTIRSIEALGHRCKLITNNTYIKKADFYDSNNIYVYDLHSFEIPSDFLNTPYKKVNNETYCRYTVKGFVSEILED